jgi:hypothetical protein
MSTKWLHWLGREDSNLRMAESKSDQFTNEINSHSGNKRDFASKSINDLGVVPERDRKLTLLVLVTKPSGKPGRFFAYVRDELIVTSRQPFLDGARALLARGYDPATPYNMRHASSATLSFVTTTIGHAAGLRVSDTRTPRFQKFVPFKGPIDEEDEAAEAAE